LCQHQAVDSSVSNSAVKAFSCHLWYLTLEMVPRSLFSCKLNEVEKPELADCLLALNTSMSGLNQAVHAKTNGLHVDLHARNSGA